MIVDSEAVEYFAISAPRTPPYNPTDYICPMDSHTSAVDFPIDNKESVNLHQQVGNYSNSFVKLTISPLCFFSKEERLSLFSLKLDLLRTIN